jgi:hypothetical protein
VTFIEEPEPKVTIRPHYRYPDWPGEMRIAFAEGTATFENRHDGSVCNVSVNASLTLAEMTVLRRVLEKAINEQTDLVAKYGPDWDEPDIYAQPVPRHEFVGKPGGFCRDCMLHYTDEVHNV